MKIVVIGGTGLIGSKVVAKLIHRGHEAIAAAPNMGVNTVTGAGLADALTGAPVVVDVVNSPSFDDGPAMDFFTAATHNVLTAAESAGVSHLVALSVVGTDRLLASGYFRAKNAPGAAHPGIDHPVLDRAGDPVLRVRADHRRFGDRRRHRADLVGPGAWPRRNGVPHPLRRLAHRQRVRSRSQAPGRSA
jgi:hypothetical protein